MGISLSILLIAAGAVLAWAVGAEVSGVDITAVGVILLVVGSSACSSRSSSGRAGAVSGAREGGGQNTTIVERDSTA